MISPCHPKNNDFLLSSCLHQPVFPQYFFFFLALLKLPHGWNRSTVIFNCLWGTTLTSTTLWISILFQLSSAAFYDIYHWIWLEGGGGRQKWRGGFSSHVTCFSAVTLSQLLLLVPLRAFNWSLLPTRLTPFGGKLEIQLQQFFQLYCNVLCWVGIWERTAVSGMEFLQSQNLGTASFCPPASSLLEIYCCYLCF